ncbi:conserved hypothetical protein [Sphingomonas aurantiaca]|uniref:Uncharacterized protein n=1 Tax=Sphingomonas aurantiaca TaxID=185949 RepID=A0A5E7ZN91_9SPHN|nr:hypothetical protein [Sphingomonas aurantiaca]VVT20132.1 conserved hypothetical protein [Sphingomonas aurantiaca]
MLAAALILGLAGQTEPFAGELKERLASPIDATLTTTKRPYDLEVCLADAITMLGIPTVLRDGPDNLVIGAASANVFNATVSVIRTGEGSQILIRVKGKGFNDRVTSRVRQCL